MWLEQWSVLLYCEVLFWDFAKSISFILTEDARCESTALIIDSFGSYGLDTIVQLALTHMCAPSNVVSKMASKSHTQSFMVSIWQKALLCFNAFCEHWPDPSVRFKHCIFIALCHWYPNLYYEVRELSSLCIECHWRDFSRWAMDLETNWARRAPSTKQRRVRMIERWHMLKGKQYWEQCSSG